MTVSTEASTPAPVSTESMKGFLEAVPTEPVKASPEEAPEAEESDEDTSEPDEVEAAPDDSEEKVPEKKPEGEKKANRTQRLKAQRDAAFAQRDAAHTEVAASKKDRVEAIGIANHWRAHAKALERELQRIVKESGYTPDPRDAELFVSRRESDRQELEKSTAVEVSKIETEHAKAAETRRQAELYRGEAESLSKKYAGLEPHGILLAFAMAADAGQDLTMEQVASNLARATGATASPAVKQRETNDSAPKTLRTGRTPAPSYKNTTGDWKAFLTSRGV